jgi:trimeric autotransporter adhesin
VGSDGTITGQSSLSKYFKAKSSTSSYTETITNPDGTTTTVTTNLTDTDAKANGDNSVAIGPNAVSNGKQSVALGDGAVTKGTANRGIAIGQGAITGVTADMPADQGSDISTSSGGIDSISIGTDSNSRGNDAISIGHNAVVQNIPIDGSGTEVSSGSIAIGSDAKVYGSNNSLAFGTGASVAADNVNGNTADEAIAIGYNAAVKQNATRAIAIGSESVADKALAIAIGYKSTSAKNSLALGNEANAAEKGLAIGNAAQSKSADAQAFGNGAVANSVGDISIGNQAGVGSDEKRANVDGALIAIGTKAGQNVIGTANVAVGNNAGSNVHSNYNVAVGSEAGQGFQTEASTDNPQNGYNVSIGYKANDFSSDTASSSIQYATAIGAEAKAYSNGTAIGRASLANGDYTVALGENAAAYDGSSIAFGANSTAKLGNIAIGSGSDATSAISGTGYLTNQATPTSYISVGKSDNLRRISNVADGSADNDVVTVRQLKTAVSQFSSGSSGTTGGVTQDYVDQQISNLTESINSLSKKYFSVSSNPDTNVNNADNNGASANNKNAMAIGPGVAVEADDAVAVGNNTKATGAGSIAIGSEGPVSADDTGDSSHITEANGERSVSIGSGAVAQTDHSIAIGTRATNYNQVNEDNESSTQGNKSIAIGYYAETAGNSAVADG